MERSSKVQPEPGEIERLLDSAQQTLLQDGPAADGFVDGEVSVPAKEVEVFINPDFLPEIEEDPELTIPDGKSGIFATIVNILCNIIGAGVLVLPTAFNDSSLVGGLLLLVVVGIIATANLYFLIECAAFCKVCTYRLLLLRHFGQRYQVGAMVCVFLFSFGCLPAYCRIISDSMPDVMRDYVRARGLWLSPNFWLVVGGIAFFALAARRTLREMAISSFMGVATILYAIVCICIRFFDKSYELVDPTTNEKVMIAPNLDPFYVKWVAFRTAPVLVFSLCVHVNLPQYYEELKDRSPQRIYRALKAALSIVYACYTLTAVVGLITFGGAIAAAKGNVLEAYRKDDSLMNSARLCMFFHFLGVFPIMSNATRRSLNNVVFGGEIRLSTRFLVFETACITLGATVLAAWIPNIEELLDLSSAFPGSIMVLVTPSILYLSVRPHGEASSARYLRPVAYFSIVFGVVTGIVSTVVTILKWTW